MSTRNKIGFFLILVSLIALYPGLSRPMLTLEVAPTLPLLGKTTFYEQTQSVMESIRFLYEHNNKFVAFLILFFSVTVPVIKAVLLLITLFISSIKYRPEMFQFVSAIGKWSMADVFVVGIFIAFLATGSNESINAYLHDGFYYFLAYCIISIAAIQVIEIKPKLLIKAA